MTTKNMNIRAKETLIEYWQVAAIAQGYTTFSAFVREALNEKAKQTQAVLDERKAAIEAMEGATHA